VSNETLLSDEGGVSYITFLFRGYVQSGSRLYGIMKRITRRIGDLAPLESFDPAAFIGDDAAPQDVCNFVLTLALIFNDLKDLIYAQVTLQSQKRDGPFKVSLYWGEYCGIDLHLWKLMVGLFHEVVQLIKDSRDVIAHPYLQSVLKGLRKEQKDIWLSLVAAATAETKPEASRFALLIRNKVVFHYEPKEICRGYKTFFGSDAPGAQRAFVSRGNDMDHTRHFFADAAVTGYLMARGEGKFEELMTNVITSVTDLNFMLTGIVDTFIQTRRFAFRAEPEET
jgi:hypothetical protein